MLQHRAHPTRVRRIALLILRTLGIIVLVVTAVLIIALCLLLWFNPRDNWP
jgi:hypothetical protein